MGFSLINQCYTTKKSSETIGDRVEALISIKYVPGMGPFLAKMFRFRVQDAIAFVVAGLNLGFSGHFDVACPTTLW